MIWMNEMVTSIGYGVLIIFAVIGGAIVAAVFGIFLWGVWLSARLWWNGVRIRRQQQEWAKRHYPDHADPRFRNRGGDGAA